MGDGEFKGVSPTGESGSGYPAGAALWSCARCGRRVSGVRCPVCDMPTAAGFVQLGDSGSWVRADMVRAVRKETGVGTVRLCVDLIDGSTYAETAAPGGDPAVEFLRRVAEILPLDGDPR